MKSILKKKKITSNTKVKTALYSTTQGIHFARLDYIKKFNLVMPLNHSGQVYTLWKSPVGQDYVMLL